MKSSSSVLSICLVFCLLFGGCTQKSSPKINSDSARLSGGGFSVSNTLSDLSGKPVGVAIGSGADVLLSEDERFDLMRYDTASDALLGLKNNSVPAIAVEVTTAREFVKINQGLSVIRAGLGYENYGVAVTRRTPELKYKLDYFMQYLERSGARETMLERWILTGEDIVEMPEYEISHGQVLRVGIDATLPPFVYFGEHHEILGYDIEFINHFADYYDFRIEYFESQIAGLLLALDSGAVDLVISSVAITPDRKERYLFSQPYYSNEVVLVVRTPADSQQIDDLSSLPGRSLALLSERQPDLDFSAILPDSQLFFFENESDQILAVQAGRIEALACNSLQANKLAGIYSDLKILPQNIELGRLALALDPGRSDLKEQLDTQINRLKEEGFLDELGRKWSDPDASAARTASVLTGTDLRFGITHESPPYAFWQDSQLVGLDIDLITAVAAGLGRQPRIVELEKSQAGTALKNGQVDVICGGLLLPEETQTDLLYTVSYAAASLSILAPHTHSVQPAGFWSRLADSFYNNLIREHRYILILNGLRATIVISFFSILAGTLLGAFICIMKRSSKKALSVFAHGYVKVIQGIPILVLLLVVCYVIFANIPFNQTVIAVIAFTLYFSAYVCEILDAALNSVDKGQWEAATSLGYTWTGAFIKQILPQAFARGLPLYRSECITLIKETSIVGFIAILDLTKASEIIRSRTFEAFFPLIMIAAIYFVIAWAMTYTLRILEDRMDIRKRRRTIGL